MDNSIAVRYYAKDGIYVVHGCGFYIACRSIEENETKTVCTDGHGNIRTVHTYGLTLYRKPNGTDYIGEVGSEYPIPFTTIEEPLTENEIDG